MSDEHADAATRNETLKLVFRLLDFTAQEDEGLKEVEWVIPAKLDLRVLRSRLEVVEQYLETPVELGGKKPKELLVKTRKKGTRHTRRRRGADSEEEENKSEEDDDGREDGKRARRRAEERKYKSAQFIEDSDAECGDMEAFLEREQELRTRMARAAEENGRELGTMREKGTKKRRRGRGREDERAKRVRTAGGSEEEETDGPRGGAGRAVGRRRVVISDEED